MNLTELRKLAEAATPGQWESYETRVYLPHNSGGFDIRNSPNAENNAAYIAAANPATILALLDLIAQCKEALMANIIGTSGRTPKTHEALAAIEQWEKK